MTNESNPPLILALTVGGTPAPLETAISEAKPDILLLFASAAASGAVSSKPEADKFKAAFEAGGAERKAKVIDIPADDPDRAFGRIVAEFDEFRKKHNGCRIIANYTGGTKSMSAALLTAAIHRDLEAQITTGRRDDLVKVASGTEAARDIEVRLIGIERDLVTALRVAAHGDYGAAAGLIGESRRKVERESLNPPKSLNKRLKQSHDWANCLAAWDRFDHKTAWNCLETGLDAAAPWAESLQDSGHAAILADLAQGRDEPRMSLCQDLLENARRRERQGRYDDALARLYRLTEACAQTRLYQRYGLKSGELSKSDLPPEILKEARASYNPRSGREAYSVGLMQTMRLLKSRDPNDPLAKAYGDKGPVWLSDRNHSILAHGYRSIDARLVKEAFNWIDQKVLPAMGMTRMNPFPENPLLD